MNSINNRRKAMLLLLKVSGLLSGMSLFAISSNTNKSNKIDFKASKSPKSGQTITLPSQRGKTNISFDLLLQHRASTRDFTNSSISFEDFASILFAAQGETQRDGWVGRTAPSAGALYPMELYVVTQRVEGLDNGLYRYLPKTHQLKKMRDGLLIDDLYKCAYGNPESIKNSAFSIVLTYVKSRVEVKYGSRADRYALIESGAVAQNIYLQSISRGYGTVFIGAVDDELTYNFLNESEFSISPVSVMPIGTLEKQKINDDIYENLTKEMIDDMQNGWNLAGSSKPITSGDSFQNAQSIWRYKGEKWLEYTNNKSEFTSNSFEGFWIRK